MDTGEDLTSKYKKTNLREHILNRPDSYTGSNIPIAEKRWVLKNVEDNNIEFEERDLTYVPALCALFDELLANACDRTQLDPECNEIRVKYSREEGWVSVQNNGKGVPVVEHPEHKILIPQMIFGHLLTSSNYDDTIKRTTGGRNGLGSKLCNIFGKKFQVETSCLQTGKKYSGTWTDNMTQYAGDKVGPALKTDFTRVTFWPDWTRLNLEHFTPDHESLLCKRVADVAGTVRPGVKVYLNDRRVQLKSFKDYCQAYIGKDAEIVYDDSGERWSFAIAASPPNTEFRQTSFVNNLCTSKGGTHVDYITNESLKCALVLLRRAHKDLTIKPAMLKSRIWVFCNARIENPNFSSQVKDELKTPSDRFGSLPVIDDKLLKKVIGKKIFDDALDTAKGAQDKQLQKTDGTKRRNLTGVPKLEDANKAGTKDSHKCTLWLTEGDSAKALAMSGLSVIGRDYHGVFPLKGKLLNVREATAKQLLENEEVGYLKKILGLKQGQEYTDVKELRYGRVMIMADADKDGSHIKGLVINFFQYFWPSLFKINGFLCEFVTPVVCCTKKGKETVNFYTQTEFDQWYKQYGDQGWSYKYYKGLGTSTREDAKRYFSDLDHHIIKFHYSSAQDDDSIQLAFVEKNADRRKEWISNADPNVCLDMKIKELLYRDFVNKELVYYSLASNERAIPHLMDGLKPSQRKILFTMLSKNIITDGTKVATIGGYVSQMAAYHHGEASLFSTMVGMAQDYVGSNNINLLHPNGQFGTRAEGGKDAASARYIYTFLNKVSLDMFPASDYPVLKYCQDDGKSVEPYFYAPVLPLSLINGADGIGTGWSTYVPCHRYTDIIKNLVKLMNGDQNLDPMVPWYRGFKGTIVQDPKAPQKYHVSGVICKFNNHWVEITELPIGKWTADYKKFLEQQIEKSRITRFEELHTDMNVRFKVFLSDGQMEVAEKEGLETFFKLKSTILTSNMVLFNPQGRLTKYENTLTILKEYYATRLELYESRRQYLIASLQQELVDIDQKVKFIRLVISGALEIRNRPYNDILIDFAKMGLLAKNGSYNHFLDMKMGSLTRERVQKLEQLHQSRTNDLNRFLAATAVSLWREDLKNLVQSLQDEEKAELSKKSTVSQKRPFARVDQASAAASALLVPSQRAVGAPHKPQAPAPNKHPRLG